MQSSSTKIRCIKTKHPRESKREEKVREDRSAIRNLKRGY